MIIQGAKLPKKKLLLYKKIKVQIEKSVCQHRRPAPGKFLHCSTLKVQRRLRPNTPRKHFEEILRLLFFFLDTAPSLPNRHVTRREQLPSSSNSWVIFWIKKSQLLWFRMSFQDLEAGRLRPPQQQRLQRQQQDPSQAVASGIFQVNTAVYSFSRLVNSLGTPKDTLQLRDKL